ncbi:SLC13 family permease [Hydrocarboniclastica marina]|uniref:SLC13 family permease n=1 Tax=Hydrocarboniclastica marina TaxID=2259620 RepID=A0A4P7XJ39_9ALTE|nr:SLC13 family permease [Hydrocarboniclastica marina]QCF27129.1 SLC13 family permease [Hydrocarboniclastica marina]
MTQDQIVILTILTATIGMFLWGRWRHDMVALGALLACVVAGLVPSAEAFAGFGHPAVITVACVLILSYGLQRTGAVDALAKRVLPTAAGPMLSLAVLTALGAVLSAFMNNVGAMALLMPIAIHLARKHELPPGKALMPLAFGTILGGMTTLIGTPPNLIVSGFRAEAGLGSFGMFDFAPVGLAVAVTGVVFVVLIGRYLVPRREQAGAESFDTGTYFTEVRVTEDGKANGKTLRKLEAKLEEVDGQIVGLVRNAFRVTAPSPGHVLQPSDVLVLEAEPEALSGILSNLGLELAAEPDDEKDENGALEETDQAGEEDTERREESEDVELQELVAMPTSSLIGRSADQLGLRAQHNLNLIALSREGMRSIKRLRSTPIQAGDLLLMQGTPEALSGFASKFSCAPLADRSLTIPDKGRATIASLVMAAAIGGAAFGLLPAAVSFAAGVLVFMALWIVPPRQVYETIDWPVIVLLAALIPVAGAMATTGAADFLAGHMLNWIAQDNAIIALTAILVVTMVLSDFMNNAATAAVMAPVAISSAAQLGVNPDTFLMSVAIGASCAFITPIGHQNNTLILGPGGFRFGDYWRLGLPLELLVVAVSVPMLLWVWPL